MKEIHAILAALVIFFAGIITGGMMTKLYLPATAVSKSNTSVPVNPGLVQRMEFLGRITKQLNLSPQQQEKVNTILNRSQDRSKKLWHQVYPQFQAEFDFTRNEIREILGDKQRTKFEELLKLNAKKRSEEAQSKQANRDRRKTSQTNEIGTNNVVSDPLIKTNR